MDIADKILVVLGFAFGIYGSVLLAAWAIPSLRGLRVLAPSSWWTGKTLPFIARAGYSATFGFFVGFQTIGQNLFAGLFAVPAIIFAGILIERSLRKPGSRSDA